MKTKIIIGSLLAVCMLVMIPSISAVETAVVEETTRSYSIEDFVETVFDRIRDIATKILLSPMTLFLLVVRAIFGDLNSDAPTQIPALPEGL